jgi:PAT family acetyl-CoA transporter-like MFS transporter 1
MESHPKEQGQQQQLRRPPLRRSLGGGIPILFLLYMLQGIPFGLVTGSLPVLLSGGATPAGTPPTHRSSSGGGDYRASSYISVASLPYGLKLLAAPVVDTVYSSNLGRRRSWILPVNVVCGLLWWELSSVIDSLVMDAKEPPQKPNGKDGAVEGTLGRDIAGGSSAIEEVQLRRSSALWRLTARLFLVVSVTAVGDVATDGWALTVRHSLLPAASLAQTLGMTVGNFLTNAGVLCGQTRVSG